MKVRRFLFGVSAALVVAMNSSALATIIITTNMSGADAEVREDQVNADLFTGLPAGGNRGADLELASRILDDVTINATTNVITNAHPTNDRSSIMFMKFDISNLPGHLDPFWANKKVTLRTHVRNNNLPTSRLWNNVPTGNVNDESTFVRMNFKVRGLDPGGTYIEDDANAANRVDDFGNPYTSTQYRYNWNEGNGTAGSGITYFDAPGLKPYCMNANACNPAESLGEIEGDYSSDTVTIGDWQWRLPRPANHLPVGGTLDFTDDDLKALIVDAKMNGRTSITLMVSSGLDGTKHRPTVGRNGTTPDSMLNFNYLVIPKEMQTLVDDTTYDPDNISANNYHAVNNPGGNQEVGSPFSCTFNATTRPQCTGLGSNATGAFSPRLIIRVPEPASVVLLALGSLFAWTVARRRRA